MAKVHRRLNSKAAPTMNPSKLWSAYYSPPPTPPPLPSYHSRFPSTDDMTDTKSEISTSSSSTNSSTNSIPPSSSKSSSSAAATIAGVTSLFKFSSLRRFHLPRLRTTSLVFLLFLSLLSFYLLSTANLSSSSYHRHVHQEQDLPHPPLPPLIPHKQLNTGWNSRPKHPSSSSSLVLNPLEELAALTSFLAALPQNVLPPDVQGNRPLDPQLILDFDVSAGSKAQGELAVVKSTVWEENPIVVFTKRHSPISRAVLALLNSLTLNPPPTIFELDDRPDAHVLASVLTRLLETDLNPVALSSKHEADVEAGKIPVAFVGGRPLALDYDALRLAYVNKDSVSEEKKKPWLEYRDDLVSLVKNVGVSVQEKKKKKG